MKFTSPAKDLWKSDHPDCERRYALQKMSNILNFVWEWPWKKCYHHFHLLVGFYQKVKCELG